jgi:hypothetical protein
MRGRKEIGVTKKTLNNLEERSIALKGGSRSAISGKETHKGAEEAGQQVRVHDEKWDATKDGGVLAVEEESGGEKSTS